MVPSIVFRLVMLYGNILFVHQLIMAVQFGYHLPMQVQCIISLELWQYKMTKLIINNYYEHLILIQEDN